MGSQTGKQILITFNSNWQRKGAIKTECILNGSTYTLMLSGCHINELSKWISSFSSQHQYLTFHNCFMPPRVEIGQIWVNFHLSALTTILSASYSCKNKMIKNEHLCWKVFFLFKYLTKFLKSVRSCFTVPLIIGQNTPSACCHSLYACEVRVAESTSKSLFTNSRISSCQTS